MGDKDKAAEKAERLAAQLRENLKRRKAQGRAIQAEQEAVMPDLIRHPPSSAKKK